MERVIDQHLSDELQDLYLENNRWLSGVLFLEEETRIFRKIYDQFISTALKEDHLQHLNDRLIVLESHRNELKNLILQHQSLLESIIVKPDKIILIALIEEHIRIINEIRDLFTSSTAVKQELSSL